MSIHDVEFIFNDCGIVAVYPMKYQDQFPEEALHWFCKQIRVPTSLVVDAHRGNASSKARIFYEQVSKILQNLEKGTP